MALDFDPRETAAALDRFERRRLVEIAQAEKALPWIEADEVLAARMLVSRYSDIFGAPLASMGPRGWQVADALARRR